MKLLIVEDEKELADSIKAYLSSEHFLCEAVHDYHSALEKLEVFDYACIILDIGLPGGSGLQLLKTLKADGKSDGVLIISAKDSTDDKVLGLKSGADDYLAKPFHLSELGARVDAIIRRKVFNGNSILQLDHLTIDLHSKTLMKDEVPIDLTRKEYDLLLYFISNKNKVISKDSIIEHLYGDDMSLPDNFDFLYAHIKNLRKKLQQAGCPDYIKAVYGMGYKFAIPT
ncbi:DNA-binding response regulator, OmpR family, contains REC and winged-helix (wHTH) domain [Filimonas lacunae]|uniref:DNA-binding response regulator, OmpR family, contains REC and winged-helix (WHTH) domain n=1 Tax=Filimonas lacunae TaxID=477680 RepID=A0A173MDA4_9BACT|nr:response regulator transcription factor [Filimonas lacunae]BAV05500.1 two-component response regulator [Filimonas lacunae]SIT20701.1 DNA-binding response regulator, OmpR family, contains REC and winged-helix (wHTH) domain [Filimonas lacunae]